MNKARRQIWITHWSRYISQFAVCLRFIFDIVFVFIILFSFSFSFSFNKILNYFLSLTKNFLIVAVAFVVSLCFSFSVRLQQKCWNFVLNMRCIIIAHVPQNQNDFQAFVFNLIQLNLKLYCNLCCELHKCV